MQKALTVCQGWASLMFLPDPKDVENRTWGTRYRGDLLIHAGKSKKFILESQMICDRLGIEFPPNLPFGAIIGVVELVDCIEDSQSAWAQPDQFHWVFRNQRLFEKPIDCNGMMGLWEPDKHTARLVSVAKYL